MQDNITVMPGDAEKTDAPTQVKEIVCESRTARITGRIGGFIRGLNRKGVIVVCAVVLLGAAVMLNWMIFSGDGKDYNDYAGGLIDGEGVVDAAPADVSGEAGVSDDYFAQAVISRQRARDEAMEALQLVVDSEDALQELKDDALRDISRIASDIETEAAIESLIISKGFEDCVAVVNEASASVIVSCSGLIPSEVAQIQEIVYDQAGIAPVNLKIVERTK